jgi:O-antigen/teichoic acid export membrane protein
MAEPLTNNQRIAKNTIMLYIRMLLSVVVSLYTSRVVLEVLGVEDYGIYSVVGGVVAMFSFLNSSMAGATSRFLTFEMGKGNQDKLQVTFSSALIIHIAIALIVLLLAETVGLWFLNNKLVIPEERMHAAHWVLQFSVISMLVNFTQVPYNAAIIAHEKMDVYAYVEMLNVFLKLGIVYLLKFGGFDKLILYSFLVLSVTVLIASIYRIYCIRNYEETHFRWFWDLEVIRPMFKFSAYDLFGNMCYTARLQGTNFLLNIFFGAIINAANGISSVVQGTLLSLSSSVITAFKPQIIKSYANQDYNKFNYYINFGAKLSSTLLLIITVPLLLNMQKVLMIWLGQIPEGVLSITRILLVANVFTINSQLLVIGIHASGTVKLHGLCCGWLYLLSLPLIYLLLHLGCDYIVVYYVVASITLLYLVFTIAILFYLVKGFDWLKFILRTFLPQIIVAVIAIVFTYYLVHNSIDSDNIRLITDTIVSCFVILVLTVIFLDSSEKQQLYNIFKKYANKINP